MFRAVRPWILAAGLAAAGLSLAGCVSPTAGLSCAWANRTDPAQLNVAYPDANATYYTLQYRLARGQSLILHGTYPSARYFSLHTHTTLGNTIDSTRDDQIRPDRGSANPFTDAAAPARRRYTVLVRAGAPPTGGGNVISAGTGSGLQAGVLMLRVYVPDDPRDQTGGAGLPTVAVRTKRRVIAVPTCPNQVVNPAVLTLVNTIVPDPDLVPPPTPVFRHEIGANLFPNRDNAYAAALTTYQPGRIVVVRGKAPTVPDTRHGMSVTTPTQLRYWSLCNNQYVKPFPVDGLDGCAADFQVALDIDGTYTFVVSTAAERPATATAANHVTWLDWTGTSVPGVLIMRTMDPAPTFTNAVQNVPLGADVAAAMGAYAPIAKYCTTASFDERGAVDC